MGVDAARIAELLEVPVEDVRAWTRFDESSNALGELVALLERRLAPDRIPAVVRRPAPAYDGRSVLDMIADARSAEALAKVSAALDFASPA